MSSNLQGLGSLSPIPVRFGIDPNQPAPQAKLGRHSVQLGKADLPAPRQQVGGAQQAQGQSPLQRTASVRALAPGESGYVPPLKANAEAVKLLSPQAPVQVKGHQLMTADELVRGMGKEPRKDARLFGIVGPRVWHRDVAYREVKAGLESYRAQLDRTAGRDPEARKAQVAELRAQLQEVATSIDRHLAKKQEPAMQHLRQQVREELRLLDSLDDGSRLANVAGTRTFSELLELRAKGLPLSVGQDLAVYNDANLDPSNPPKPLGSGQMNTVTELHYTGGVTRIFKPLTANMGDPAEQLGIRPSDTRFANRNIAAALVDQGLGFNLLPKTSFAIHNGELGIVMEKVGGKAPADPGPDSLDLDKKARKLLAREQGNLPDEFTTLPDHARSLSAHIDKATGNWTIRPSCAEHLDSHDPQVMQQLNRLEWLDCLISSGDRHTGNYMVDVQPGANNGPPTVTIKGIDNDYAFSSELVDPSQRKTEKMVGLPRLIDPATAQSLRHLHAHWHDQGGMKEQLAQLLSPEELNAMKMRLNGMVAHIDYLTQNNMVVNDWSSFQINGKSAHDIMMDKPTPWAPSSYVRELEREIQHAKDTRTRFG